MTIEAIEIFRAEMPLKVPYKVSRWTFTAFDPLIASIRLRDGRLGWGEATIQAGYALDETPETGWTSLKKWSERVVGRDIATAMAMLEAEIDANSHAASILISALEMAEHSSLLMIDAPAVVPLLVGRTGVVRPRFDRVRQRTLTIEPGGLEVQRDRYAMQIPWESVTGVQQRKLWELLEEREDHGALGAGAGAEHVGECEDGGQNDEETCANHY